MKRPSKRDRAVIDVSAAKWAYTAGKNYPDLVEGFDSLAETLATAAGRSHTLDPAEIAAELARRLHEHVDSSLLDAVEEYLSFHDKVHRETVESWLAAYGPARPFAAFARVLTKGRTGTEEGLGLMDARYDRTGEFMFLPDAWREGPVDDSGLIRRWKLLPWEDVEQVLELEPGDAEAVERHQEASARQAAEAAASRRQTSARHGFKTMVKKFDGIDATEAQEIYARLAGTPEKAARIIAALSLVATAEIEKRRPEEEPRAPEGMMP